MEEEEAFWEQLNPRQDYDEAPVDEDELLVFMSVICTPDMENIWYYYSEEKESDRANWECSAQALHDQQCGCGATLDFS